ncbi:MAG: FliH/SctL family protein [Sandaracinaceae bacterium]
MARILKDREPPPPLELLSEWTRARDAAYREITERLAELAGAIAKRAVLDAVTLEPDAFARLAEQALERVRRASELELRVHPDDAPLVARLDARVVKDATLTRGSCIVRCELGEIDAGIDARVERLVAALGSGG